MTDIGPTQLALPMFERSEDITSQPSTSSLAGSHVRTSQSQVKDWVFQKALALVFGLNSPVLLANFDPTLCYWKTSQASLPGMEPSLLLTLPKWGTWDTGALYRLPTPVRPTNASGGFLWPTATTGMEQNRQPSKTAFKTKSGTYRHRMPDGRSSFMRLDQVAKLWPTPTAIIHRNRRAPKNEQVAEYQQGTDQVVHTWSTPAARDYKDAMLPPASANWDSIPGDLKRSGHTGYLNPEWVEALMGYPQGWTDIAGPRRPDRSTHGSRRAFYPNPRRNCATGCKRSVTRSSRKLSSQSRRR